MDCVASHTTCTGKMQRIKNYKCAFVKNRCFVFPGLNFNILIIKTNMKFETIEAFDEIYH